MSTGECAYVFRFYYNACSDFPRSEKNFGFTQKLIFGKIIPSAYIVPEYEMLTKEVTGRKRYLYHRRGNEDTETVQILDKSGKLWTTYFKKDLRSSSIPQAGVMPENFADILSVQQMHDLLAYLLTLK